MYSLVRRTGSHEVSRPLSHVSYMMLMVLVMRMMGQSQNSTHLSHGL